MRNLLTAIVVLLCVGCSTVRPTLFGQVMNASTRRGVKGATVTVRYMVWQQDHVWAEAPDPLVISFTDPTGRFSCKASQCLICAPSLYRVRVHHDGFSDAIYDFHFQPSGFIFPVTKNIGTIWLQPHTGTGAVAGHA